MQISKWEPSALAAGSKYTEIPAKCPIAESAASGYRFVRAQSLMSTPELYNGRKSLLLARYGLAPLRACFAVLGGFAARDVCFFVRFETAFGGRGQAPNG